ncbi:MAG: response regulator transcription factor, partial [Planctomycetota bacterium]
MTTANQTIEIMLVDDHQLVRDALRSWLEKFTDFAVVAECGTGNEVLALAERQRPDIVVLDLLLPGMSGLEVLKQLREQLPEVKVICLSMESGAEFLTRALKLGA